MKNKLIAASVGLALLAIGGLAVAQTIAIPYVQSLGTTDIVQVVKNASPSAQSTYASMLQMRAWLLGGNSQRTGATAPALTVCGTTPAITGNDTAGIITMGTGSPTGCVITFNTAYVTAPVCSVDSQSQLTSFAFTVSATAITTVQTGTSSNIVNYICLAQAGG